MGPYDIKQANYVGHTKARGWHRIVTPAEFIGTVETDEEYFLIDDHVGFGGTLANLRGYIDHKGGTIIGMSTLTETVGSQMIAIRPDTKNMLYNKHGEKLEAFWKSIFGYTTACLTNIEAGYLSRVDKVASIQARMARAVTEARSQGISAVSLSHELTL